MVTNMIFNRKLLSTTLRGVTLALGLGLAAVSQAQEQHGSVVVGNPTGGNQGYGSLNAQSIYVNGVAVGGGGSGTVTSVGMTVPGGGVWSVSPSSITTNGTFALAVTGSSGGIPYFCSVSTICSTTSLPTTLNGYAPCINPVAAPYNADPTGVSDSTTALQGAINAANASATAKSVCIPAGTYTFSPPSNGQPGLTFNGASNISMVCASRDNTILQFNDTAGTNDAIYFYNHAGQDTIRNCQIKRVQAGSAGALIHMTDSYYMRIEDNAFFGNNNFNEIAIDCLGYNPGSIYISGNQLYNSINDAVYATCGTQTTGVVASASQTLGVPLTSGVNANAQIAIQTAATGGLLPLATTVSGTPTSVSCIVGGVACQAPSCTTTNSSTSVTSCGTLNNAIIPGLGVTDSLGCLPAGDTIATVATTSFTLTAATNGSGCGAGDTMTITGLNIMLAAAAGANAGGTAGSANPEVFIANYGIADLYIEPGQGQRNYFYNNGQTCTGNCIHGAAIELNGNVSGTFISSNSLANNNYGTYMNSQGLGSLGSMTYTNNDIDNNTTGGIYAIGFNAALYQDNLSIANGTVGITCILCTNISGAGNHYESMTNGELLEGQNSWSESGAHFTGVTNAVTIQPYNGQASTNVSIMDVQDVNTSGVFLTFSGNASYPALGVTASGQVATSASCTSGTNYVFQTGQSPAIWCNQTLYLGTPTAVNTGDRFDILNNTNGVTSMGIDNPNSGSSAFAKIYFNNNTGQEVAMQLRSSAGSPANQFEIYSIGPFLLNTVNTSAANTAGANLSITGANATGTGSSSNGGSIIITPGTSTNGTPGSVQLGTFLSSGTPFTVASGTGACATTSTVVGGPQSGKFTCTGTTGASTATLTLSAATHEYTCWGRDITTPTTLTQTGAVSTTSVTLTMTAVATNDVIQFGCLGY